MSDRIDHLSKAPPIPVANTEPSHEPADETTGAGQIDARARTLGVQSRTEGPATISPTSSGKITPVRLASAARSRGTTSAPDPHFARTFSAAEIMSDPAATRAFVSAYIAGEARFFAATRDPHTGLTYDGINLDPRTGEVVELRPHSAPSKECLDIGILIKALQGDAHALALLGTREPGVARQQATAILGKKLASYWQFYRDNPGYGGFLPWFQQPGGAIRPTDDWVGDLPGLDNGEWLWSLLIVEKTLRDQGFAELADGYGEFNDLLKQNVVPMFFDAEAGKVRADVHVEDPARARSPCRTIHDQPGRMTHLTGEHGVHEGIMLVLYTTLFGEGLPDGAADTIWDGIHFDRVEHRHGTTWRAFWGSSHESWAYLFLPFRDQPQMRQLFRLREIIRTQNAAERGYPGFGTSTNLPGADGWTGYLSASGIEGIGTQPVDNNDVYAIYGAFPLLLEHAGREVGNVGLAWLRNMLDAPRAQGPWGAGESVTNDGEAISPCKTIDGTFPNLLAIMGGLEREAAAMLREHGLYERFIERMTQKMQPFSRPLREPSGFALPTAQVSHDNRSTYERTPARDPVDYGVRHPRVTISGPSV